MKKLFALLLAVVMVISMAACAPAEPAGTTAATDAPKETTTAATTTEAAVDMSVTPFVEPGSVKLTIGIPVNATVLDYDDNYLTKKLEELSGLDLEFVFFSSDPTEAMQQLTLMVANKEKLPDILIYVVKDHTNASQLADAGVLADLTPYWEGGYAYNADQYINLMSDYERSNFWTKLKNPTDGKIYFFPGYKHDRGADACTYLGGMNEVMAKNVGMDVTEIDTVAEVYEFLKKTVNEDGNGNGKKDELGLLAPLGGGGYRPDVLLWLINAYVYCNDTYKWNATDGELWSPYDTDEYRKALIELNKWYKEGLINTMIYSMTAAEMKTILDVPADQDTISLFGDTPTVVTNAETTIGERYYGLNVLQDETGLGGYGNMRNPYAMLTCGVITTSCENVELAFRFLDLWCRDDMYHTARYGEEGYGWEQVDGEAEGLKTGLGLWAGIRVLNDEWSKESKQTWKNNVVYFWTEDGVEAGICCGGTVSAGTVKGTRGYPMNITLESIRAAEKPAELVYDLAYNAKEMEVYNEYWSVFGSYVSESRAKFITGVLDPSNDADWETYLKELEANGQSDLLEIAQSAYDRLMG